MAIVVRDRCKDARPRLSESIIRDVLVRVDPTLLDHLWARLESLQRLLSAATPTDRGADRGPDYLQQVRRLWVEAYGYFDRTVNDANDCLAAMHRARPEDIGQVEAFLAYKDVLVQYLSAFVNQLMDSAERIRGVLTHWDGQRTGVLLVALLVRHDTTLLPGPDGRLPEAAVVRAHFQTQYQALEEWFRRRGGVDMLRRVTADAIEKIVRHAQRLVDGRQMGVNRRQNLERLARAFAGCPDLDAAHRLASVALDCATPRHLLGSLERLALDERNSVWQQEPIEVPLNPIRRGGRARRTVTPIANKRREQQQLLMEALARRDREAALWDALFQAGEVDLGRLEFSDPTLRARLLTVIGNCLAAPRHTALAADGSRIQLLEPTGPDTYGELAGPDGILIMPRFRLRRSVGVTP